MTSNLVTHSSVTTWIFVYASSSHNSIQQPNYRIHSDSRSLFIKPAFSYYMCCVSGPEFFIVLKYVISIPLWTWLLAVFYNLSQQNIVQCLVLYEITYHKLCAHKYEYMCVNLCSGYCYCLCFVYSYYIVFINMSCSAQSNLTD